MNNRDSDASFMARCLELARLAEGNTSPNPMVGSVVVDDTGSIVGSGYHHKAGEPHAEVNALKEAGDKSQGATIYVSLEPCSHQGKTPPCTNAIINAGIKRVVAASGDPNPRVNGNGFKLLKEAGIEVSYGILEEEALWLNRAFMNRISKARPWVTLKLASTLDGRISDRFGNSKWITGEDSRKFVQELRKKNDCILVGIGTVRADDPRLNVRINSSAKAPVRAVIDPGLTIDPEARCLHQSNGAPTLIYCKSSKVTSESIARLNQAEEAIVVQLDTKGINLKDVLEDMANRDINAVLCEGGSKLASQLLLEDLVDEIFWFIAPKLLPDKNALQSTGIDSPIEMKDILEFETIGRQNFGMDTMIHLKK